MRRAALAFAACCAALVLDDPSAAQGGPESSLEGRWTGAIEIPGRTLPLVVDLAPRAEGAWVGSIIITGLGIKGAPLANVAASADDVTFDTGVLLASPALGPARFKAKLVSADRMTGEMSQGGNAARFSLRRTGSAQVESAAQSTPVSSFYVGRWTGAYELGGYPRNVTIIVENKPGAGAAATFVIVGKQTTNVPVDLVIEDGEFLRIHSQANRITFEGRFVRASDELRGTVELGPFELPIVLRRLAERSS